jgi:hypothetical protein
LWLTKKPLSAPAGGCTLVTFGAGEDAFTTIGSTGVPSRFDSTLSAYVPGATMTVSPGCATSTPLLIVFHGVLGT